MNNRATLKANVIYILLAVGFIIIMSAFVWDQSKGSALWSDYYAKEITRIINTATPGQEVTLDIHKATEIAHSKGINNFNAIFEFHNERNEVCVKLSSVRKSCYRYFHDVDIVDYRIIYGRPINFLSFKVQDKPTLEEKP
jgi:hypothetical protein